jgi:uncharacterized cupin superfamily protein
MRFTAWDLGSAAGSVTVGLRRYRLDEGDRPTPPHVHGAEEEIFFVLDGSGLSWQDGRTHEIRAGDCLVHRAAEEVHTLVGGRDGLDVLVFGMRVPVEIGYLPRARGAWLWPTWVESNATLPWEYDWSGGPELWHREVEAGELELPAPTERPETVVNVDEVPGGPFGGPDRDVEAHWRDLGTGAGSRKTGIKHVQVAPGKLGALPHCHSAEEELLVVLEGEGWLELTPSPGLSPHHAWRIGGTDELEPQRYPLRVGSVVSRRAGSRVAHTVRAAEAGLTYLVYGTRDPNDMAFYPRSGKIYWRGLGVMARVEHVSFWDGET